MDTAVIKFKLLSIGYRLLIPHGPESFDDGSYRWIYTAYVEKKDSIEIVAEKDYILIDSEAGDSAIEEFLFNNAIVYLHQKNVLVLNVKGELIKKSCLLIFKI